MESQSVTEAILALERAALDEWSTGNPAGYTQSGAEDVTYFDDIGAQSRISGLHAAREYGASLTEHIPEHRYEIIDPKVQVYGEVAILTFQYQPISLEGENLTLWKASSVYRRSEGEWRLVHGHWSMNKSS